MGFILWDGMTCGPRMVLQTRLQLFQFCLDGSNAFYRAYSAPRMSVSPNYDKRGYCLLTVRYHGSSLKES